MKRWIRGICAVMAMLLLIPSAAVSATDFTQETDYAYATLLTGGVDNTLVYAAYDADGAYVIGTMTANGEQSREAYSFGGWQALFAPEEWTVTIVGDGAALCPYVGTHTDSTICPYLEISCVTMTNADGVTLENYYVPSGVSQQLPSGSVHFCWGRYGYKDPSTLRWDGESRYFALKNESGLWGVYDAQSDTMEIAYTYADMSAVYDDYAKVFDGAAWGRLDLSGAYPTQFVYASQEDFSVKAEIRLVGDGQYRVFSKDNEPISAVIAGAYTEISYAEDAFAVSARTEDGTSVLIDLDGTQIASFDALTEVRYLQDVCYAAERRNADGALEGIALWSVTDAVTPRDRFLAGDVNFDGAVNSIDARLALSYLIADRPLTALQQSVADVDRTDAVETGDVRNILCRGVQA